MSGRTNEKGIKGNSVIPRQPDKMNGREQECKTSDGGGPFLERSREKVSGASGAKERRSEATAVWGEVWGFMRRIDFGIYAT